MLTPYAQKQDENERVLSDAYAVMNERALFVYSAVVVAYTIECIKMVKKIVQLRREAHHNVQKNPE